MKASLFLKYFKWFFLIAISLLITTIFVLVIYVFIYLLYAAAA